MKTLHLEDNGGDAELVRGLLLEEWPGSEITVVATRDDFLEELIHTSYDVILSEFRLGSFNGLEALQLAREKAPDTPFIFLSRTPGEDPVIDAVQAGGASDFIFKGRIKHLVTAISSAVRASQERRKRYAAEDSHRRLVAILENTPDFVGMASPNGQAFYINRAGLRMLGMSDNDDAGNFSITDFHPAETGERLLRECIPAALRDGTWTGESLLLTRDGREIPVSQVIIAHYAADGGVEYLSTIMRDLTTIQDAQERIREQAEIITKAREAIMIVGFDDRFIFWNEGAERLFGWKAAEVLGKRAEDFFQPFVCKQVQILRAATRVAGEWTGEMRLHTKSGRSVIVENRVTLVRDNAGRPRARLNITTDITARKQMEEQLLRAQRLESIGMLAAGIAHDLNNVLAPILMAAPMLREHATDPIDLKMIESLEKSAQRGAGLVRQILSFAHGAGGEHRLVQVKHLLRDITNVISETFPKNIRFEQTLPTNLWPIMANPTQIHQVLLNLCVNARDAMPGGGTLRLTAENRVLDELAAQAIEGGRPGAFLVLHIEDTGTGIPPEVLAHIWEPFFTTKEADKGTGLGLSTVRGIVGNHQGFITLQTAPGLGTSFSVFIPAGEGILGAETGATPVQMPRGRGELILVVDDEMSVRDVTTAILVRHGYRVLVARDGDEAVALFTPRSNEISLVVSDVNMPNLDGAALAGVIQHLNPSIKILAVSGMSRGAPTTGSAHPYAGAFLLKPFSAEELLVGVHNLLQPVMAVSLA